MMWFFDLIPGTLLYLVFFAAVIGYLVSLLLPGFVLQKQVKLISVIVLVISIYLLGMHKTNTHWKALAKDLETQVVVAEAKSAAATSVITQKTIVKTQVIKQKGEDIIQYVDREVTKYNNTCVIPKEFILTHNRAAEQTK